MLHGLELLIMVGFTLAISIIIPATLETPILMPPCNITYVSSPNCAICEHQIAEINNATLNCTLDIVSNFSSRKYILYTTGSVSPFWVDRPTGKRIDTLLTTQNIENITRDNALIKITN